MTCLYKRLSLISLGLLIMALGSEGDLTVVPINTAVPLGASRVVVSCASTDGPLAIAWSYFPVGGTTPVNIAYASSVVDTQKPYYATEQSNLIILSATMARAGIYSCIQGAFQPSAQLIVMNSELEGSMMPNATELMYNQTVQMSCSISYTANTSYVAVNMNWSMDDPPISVNSSEPRTNISANLTTAVSTITLTPGNFTPFPIYRCNVSFRIIGNPPNGPTKAPEYSKSTSFSSPINVIYLRPANESTITGARSGDSVYLGTNVTCNVDANPPANYSWLDVTYRNTTNSSIIQIWHDGEYQCTAWNKAAITSMAINVTTHTTTTASTTTTPTTTPTTTVTSGRSSPSGSDRTASAGQDSSTGTGGLTETQKNIIIGVVVGVGGALLIGAITLIVCCCLKKKKNKLDKYVNEGTPSGKPPPYDDGRHGPPPHHHHGSANPDLVNEGYRLDEYPLPQQYPLHNDPRQSRPYVVDDEGLNYAQIQLDNNPRSRQPLQMKDETNYTDVRLA